VGSVPIRSINKIINPMSTILSNFPSRIAAKPHHCWYCGQSIAVGEKHVYRTGVNTGDFWTMRAHPECDEYADKNWDEGDYECHFQGDMERPPRKEQPEDMLRQLENASKAGLDGSPYDRLYKWAFDEITRLSGQKEYWEKLAKSNARAHNVVEDERFNLLQKNKELEIELTRLQVAMGAAIKVERPWLESRDLLYGALTLAMQKVERLGASKELTDLVVLLGNVKSVIGNRWNPANPYALKPLVTALNSEAIQYESRPI
jgi:hypothetical protein